MKLEITLGSTRTHKAKTAAKIGAKLGSALYFIAAIFTALATGLWFGHYSRLSYLSLAMALAAAMVALWYGRDLKYLLPIEPARTLDDVLEAGLLADLSKHRQLSPQTLWQIAVGRWEGAFICAHLRLDPSVIAQSLPAQGLVDQAWLAAMKLMQDGGAKELDGGVLVVALIATSRPSVEYIVQQSLKIEDVFETYYWLARLSSFMREKRPYFGGFGRDWAAGFTPLLDQYGENISSMVESGRGHFHTQAHNELLDTLVNDLQEQGTVSLVGDPGTGKSSLVYALAERLLKGKDKSLLYYHVVALDAAAILSDNSSRLEKIMLQLFSEAVHARNIIIFLDDAQLFFSEAVGAFNMSKLLLPAIQNHAIKIVAAFTPDDFQSLRASDQSLAALLNPVNVKEPDETTNLRILEDTALTFEARSPGVIITYQSLKEAIRLSGQYMQELSYPGKAIALLEQSLNYAQNKIVTPESVQQAIQTTQGVKVTKVEGPESDILLHLEERIHERMINQERAVKLVSAALRRGRAGVADPNRPIGSFLFLGPTGVGKTELARSLSAVYFGDQGQMIRLDMSEYQTPSDVPRLLEAGGTANRSLILQMREQPFSVVLLDEVEKAHPNVLNLLLQMLDEGRLTDEAGKPASFKNAIIICTSNAGSAEIGKYVESGNTLENFERPLIDQLISAGIFRAELINRFDEIVLFRPLNQNELTQVAKIMLAEVNKVISRQNITVQLTDNALFKLVQAGYDPEFGARPMRRVIQQTVEDAVATKILSGEASPGSTLTLDAVDLAINN